MRRIVVLVTVMAGLVGAGEARADPLLWGLQPLPGWTCDSPPAQGANDNRCAVTVAAGDVAVTCAEDRVWDPGITAHEATGCSVSQAGAPVAGCRTHQWIEAVGPTETTRECTVAGARTGCFEVGEEPYGGGNGSSWTETTCGVAAGDVAIGCERFSGRATNWSREDAGCSVAAGDLVCGVAVEDLTGAPVVTPRCPEER